MFELINIFMYFPFSMVCIGGVWILLLLMLSFCRRVLGITYDVDVLHPSFIALAILGGTFHFFGYYFILFG